MVFYTDIPIGRGTYKTQLFNKLKQTSQNVLLYVKKYYESTMTVSVLKNSRYFEANPHIST